jgi:hypothetical protein
VPSDRTRPGGNWATLTVVDRAAITAAIEAINASGAQSWEASHAVMEQATTGMSSDQQLGVRVGAADRFGRTRQVEKLGHLVAENMAGVRMASSSEIRAGLAEAERAPVQRTAVPRRAAGRAGQCDRARVRRSVSSRRRASG